ncbi:hypothetical protein C2E25_07345 [Geothermobacter hydrogeniphilus]|uniref:Cell division and transport-associated protein TolA n=1 Tax=Geothermobacter hydrogeniphilus TaxID=1969733 RepID=A0A2K2HAT1_9BACT|nr:TonB C-terminal domain-containing protein [Geothermobacter hydrogeniphilus]PNU20371.1 hypothetical protein C2E25_07345 [Geothermobacter hydrogeniphilus]
MSGSGHNNRWRRQAGGRRDPRLAAMLGYSFGLHLLLVLLFGGWLLPRMQHSKPPVYVVDLVNLPVKNPQAGRPDGAPKHKVKARPKAKAKPVARPKPKPKPKVKPKVKPKSRPKAVSKPRPKPKVDYRKTESAIEKLRRKREREELKRKLAALEAQDTRRAPGSKAPLGETAGTGSEAGVSYRTWLQQAYKSAWSLSKYQVRSLDLKADVEVVYDARGFLRDYTVMKSSGDRRFDDSITQAIRRVDRLEPPPGRTIREIIKFNLKDLQE